MPHRAGLWPQGPNGTATKSTVHTPTPQRGGVSVVSVAGSFGSGHSLTPPVSRPNPRPRRALLRTSNLHTDAGGHLKLFLTLFGCRRERASSSSRCQNGHSAHRGTPFAPCEPSTPLRLPPVSPVPPPCPDLRPPLSPQDLKVAGQLMVVGDDDRVEDEEEERMRRILNYRCPAAG